jgi:hypothetical protein
MSGSGAQGAPWQRPSALAFPLVLVLLARAGGGGGCPMLLLLLLPPHHRKLQEYGTSNGDGPTRRRPSPDLPPLRRAHQTPDISPHSSCEFHNYRSI